MHLALQSITLRVMRKLGILIILVLTLIAIILFYTKQTKSTLNQVESNFAVADTASIEKIFIVDKGEKEVLLQRKTGNEWIVNDKYKVKKGAIDLLLETIKRIRPKHPVANAGHNNVVRNMAGNAKKVEIYLKGNDEPVKTYYIGGTNLDKNANYMVLEGAEQPYAVHIPGFTGYISGRYILKEIDWRDRTLFALRPEKIKSINLQYPSEPKNGFQLNVINKQNYALQALAGNTKPIPLKPANALNYLQAFRFLACEAYLNDYTRTDSLLKQTPKNILTVELEDGTKQQLTIFYMPVNKRSKTQFDQAGERVLYDVDRYYATSDNTKEVVLIQEYVFGKVLNTFEEMKQLANNKPKNNKTKPTGNKNANSKGATNQIKNNKINLGKKANPELKIKSTPPAKTNQSDSLTKPKQKANQTKNNKINLGKKANPELKIKSTPPAKTNQSDSLTKPKQKANQIKNNKINLGKKANPEAKPKLIPPAKLNPLDSISNPN